MAPGAGYFFGPTHNFQEDIPTKNIMKRAGKTFINKFKV